MKIIIHLSIIAVLICLSLFNLSCKDDSYQDRKTYIISKEESSEKVLAQGKYLVGILGCNDCHSPKRLAEKGPQIIPELVLSGFPSDRPIFTLDSKLTKEGFGIFYPDLTAAAGPWGLSFASNLTPDDTGIGNWTEDQFKKALTQGKYKGMDNGRMLLPPMPWLNYINLKDADVRAIFTYLKSVVPVQNIVPSPIAPDNM